MNNTNGGQANGGNGKVTGADIPLALKARYFGSGLVVGVLVSPMVKRIMAKAQPKLDGLLDSLTGQAEGLVEKGSDLMAKAKEILAETAAPEVEHKEEPHNHSSNCTH